MHVERERLQSFLVGGDESPDPQTLRRLGLAAWTFASDDRKQPRHAELRSDFLQFFHRHQQIKQELKPLLDAWRRAGIECVLFKGFWLSETVYPKPGMRFYGDVDVLLRAPQIELARRIASELGWTEQEAILPIESYSHVAFNLMGPAGHTCLDVHRFLLHSSVPWAQPQRRITGAMWARSRARLWEGIHVRELDPVDAALVLVLQRSWGEGWQLKPSDMLDLRYLQENGDVRREQLMARAFELNCARTLRLFLERCDPWQQRIELGTPNEKQLRRYQRAVGSERPLLAYEKTLRTGLSIVRRGPGLCADIARALPAVLHARTALRKYSDIRRVLQDLTPNSRGPSPRTERQRMRAVSGARWAIKLVTRGNTPCLLRALAIYNVLKTEGWPVSFVSGVRQLDGKVIGHAWVELDGRVLPELRDSICNEYSVSFRHPNQS
jgi:hypothetical protein